MVEVRAVAASSNQSMLVKKWNHLVSTVNLTPYLAKLVFTGNDIIHASVVQPQLPLLLPFLILVREGLF